jgi:uncharacterized lipoprotein YddW (UPF0748 family)
MKPRLFLVLTVMAVTVLTALAATASVPETQSGVVTVDFTQESVQKSARRTNALVSQVQFSSRGLGLARANQTTVIQSQSLAVPFERAAPFLTFTLEVLVERGEMENLSLAFRSSEDGINFGAWQALPEDDDAERERYQPTNRIFTGLRLLPKTTKAVQYRLEMQGTSNYRQPSVRYCKLHFFSPGETPAEELAAVKHASQDLSALTEFVGSQKVLLPEAHTLKLPKAADANTHTGSGGQNVTIASQEDGKPVRESGVQDLPRPAFVTRTGWGCATGQTAGAKQSQLVSTTVTHLIIHHSYIPGNDVTDFPAAIRSMWNYHVNTQGWSDVGYNWFIDRNGVLYQGRAWIGTNENVQGSHFCGKNGNTMGVCVIGDYTSVAPSAAAVTKLVEILAYRASTRDIDPLASRLHSNSGQTFNTIVGHRILSCSTCPGDAFVPLIPGIRTRVQTALRGTPAPSLSVSSSSVNAGSTDAGTTRTAAYTVSFANLTAPVSLSVGGSNASLFSISTDGTNFGSTASIAQTATSPVMVTVRYAPTAAGSHSASVAHASGSGTATVSANVTLSGTATTPAQPGSITPSVSTLVLGSVETGQTQTATYTVSYANLTAPITFALSGANANQFSLSTNGTTFAASGSLAANRVNIATSAWYVVGTQGRFIGTALPNAVISATVDGFAIASNVTAGADGRFSFTYTFGSAGAARQFVVTATSNGTTGSAARSVEVRASGSAAAADPTVYPASVNPATITVRYAPTATGSHAATLTQSSASAGSPSASVSVSGTGTSAVPPPSLSTSVLSVNAGSTLTGTTRTAAYTVSFANLTAPVSLSVGGSNASLFSISTDGTNFGSTASIAQTATSPVTVTVRYAPTAAGSHSASVAHASGSGTATVSANVTLSGTATTPPPAPTASGPKRELRAVWIATVSNIDWPLSSGDAPSKQRQDLITMLDSHKASGINAVVLQVRPSADALYARGRREPWSVALTGTAGQDPGWDPLQFALDEAHKRGMELHAWFNPFRSVSSSSTPVASTHISQTQPSWHLTYANPFKLLNPGLSQVRQYVASVVMDVVRNYDIDGVHFDDYFYPYSGTTTEDQATFSANSRGFTNIADWRRDNVNIFVKQVRDSIQATKPHVKFGISPFGIWKSGTPAGISGLSAYDVIYCDATAWLQAGTVDYVTPQLYWRFGGAQDYAALLNWWVSQANGRHIYTGNGVYRVNETGWTAAEIPNQLRFNRTNGTPQASGAFLFSSKDVTSNQKGIRDSLRTNLWRTIALPPAMAWKDATPPNPPTALSATPSASAVTLSWSRGAAASDGDVAKYHLVYRFMTGRDAVNSNSHQFIIGMTDQTQFVDNTTQAGATYTYLVTALDKLWNESNPNPRVDNVGLSGGATLLAARGLFPKVHEEQLFDDASIPSAALLAADSLGTVMAAALPHTASTGAPTAAGAEGQELPAFAESIAFDAKGASVKARSGVVVYPNPAQELLNVQAFYDEATDVQLVVRSVLGQEMFSTRERVQGSVQLTLTLTTLPAGAYMLEMRGGTRVNVTQFIKR